MQYRKKPVVIDAWQTGVQTPPLWIKTAIDTGVILYQGRDEPYYTIKTLEGEMRADKRDWIIKGIKGELYPCKPDIFEATYEPA